MRLFQKILLIVTSALAVNAFASPADSLMELSKKWFESGRGWDFDFKVRIDFAGSPETGYQSGNILVSDNNRFRLQISGMAIYSDGKNFWQWNKDQNQVLLKLLEDMDGNMHPSELMFKYLSCKPLSMKTDKLYGKPVNVITLDASKYGKDFSQMEVWLFTKDSSPARLVTTDALGNVSTYDILNMKRQDKVNTADFVLNPEKGVDVIDMR